ncbi:AtuA-related protein [Hydrogenophaga sp.]
MNAPSHLVVPLRALAHSRSGDKGNRANISVIAYEPATWELLLEQVTEVRVRALFASRQPSKITRHVLPRLHAMNFVLDDILDGGVNGSLNLDAHGKTLSSLMLTLPLQLDVALARELQVRLHLHGVPS